MINKCSKCGSSFGNEYSVCPNCGGELILTDTSSDVIDLNDEDILGGGETPPPEPKRRNVNPMTVGVICSCAAVIIAAVLIICIREMQRERYNIVLEPVMTATEEDAKHDAAIIKERLKHVDTKTKVTTEGNIINISMYKDFIDEDTDISSEILASLARSGHWGLSTDYASKLSDFTEDNIVNVETEQLSVTEALKYSDYMTQSCIYDLEETELDTVYCLHLTLDSEAAEELETIYENGAVSGNPSFWFTRTADMVGIGFTDSGGLAPVDIESPDYSDVYLFSGFESSEEIAEMYIEAITGEKYNVAYDIFCDDDIEWEEDESDFGEYQENYLEGDTVVVKYHLDTSNNYLSKREYKKHIEAVKDRLDLLEIPYMVGNGKFDDRSFALSFYPEDMDMNYLRMIGSYGIYYAIAAQDSFQIDSMTDGERILKAGTFDSGGQYFIIDGNEGITDWINENESKRNLYFIVNDVTVGQCVTLNDRLAVVDTYTEEGGSDKMWDMIQCIDKASVKDVFYCFVINRIYTYTDGERTGDVTYNISDVEFAYDGMTSYDESNIEIIEDMGAHAEKDYNSRGVLNIYLDLDVDSDFAENFVETSLEIYKDCNLGNGAYSFIRFIVNDSDDLETDTCSMLVNIKSSSMLNTTITATGPTYSEYYDEIYDLIYTNQ